MAFSQAMMAIGCRIVGPQLNALGDDGSDEPEIVGADGAGDDVSSGDLLNQFLLVRLGVDGAVIGDCVLGCALSANLGDLVRGL